MKKDPRIHVSFILECIELVEEYLEGLTETEFLNSTQQQDAIIRRIGLWDKIHEPADLRQCGTTSPMISKYPTLRILCPTSFSRVSVSFRDSSRFLSGAPNRHLTIELTVSEIERI